MNSRKINLHYRQLTGRIQTQKHNEYIAFESGLEKDALILAEFRPDIVSYKSQPKTIRFIHELKKRKYTPDILVEYANGQKQYIEVKYREDLFENWSYYKPKFKAAINAAKLEGNTTFKIWTENEIRTPFLKNAQFLLSYKNNNINEQQGCMLIETLEKLGQSTPQDLLNMCAKSTTLKSEFLYSLWGCIARQYINVNLHEKLSMNSVIWLGEIFQKSKGDWQWL